MHVNALTITPESSIIEFKKTTLSDFEQGGEQHV